MAASLRLSRGFHRLALFLAAIPLLMGGPFSVWSAVEMAGRGAEEHQKLVCAHQVFRTDQRKIWHSVLLNDDAKVDLKEIGCCNYEYDRVSVYNVQSLPSFAWLSAFGFALLPGFPITLILTLGIYAIIRAIGWVIGGFAAS
jgi:hypothetical protein